MNVALALLVAGQFGYGYGYGFQQPRLMASLVESPEACTGILLIGQSLGHGTCSAGTCTAQSTTPSSTDFMLNAAGSDLCAAAEGATPCGWSDLESPMMGAIDGYRAQTALTAPIIGIKAAVPGSAIADWESTDTNFTSAVADVAAAVLNLGTAGCPSLVVRSVIWIQGEADFATSDYATPLATLISDMNTAILGETGQTSLPEWVLSPPSTWAVDGVRSSPPDSVTAQTDLCKSSAAVHCDAKYGGEITYESGSPYLHLQAPSYRTLGLRLGRIAYQAVEQSADFGLYMTSATISGSDVTACFNVPSGATLATDTSACPSQSGIGFSWASDVVGAPSISSVSAPSSDCYTITLDEAPVAGVGSVLRTAWAGSGTSGAGCNVSGFPYTNIVASIGSDDYWALTQEIAATGGTEPTCASTHHLAITGGNEQVLSGDDAVLDAGAAMSVAFWMRPNTYVDNRFVIERGGASEWSIRTQTTTGPSLRMFIGGVSNFSRPASPIGLSNDVATHVAITYNAGTVEWFINGVRTPSSGGGTIPATLPSSANGIKIGSTSNASLSDFADVAWWDRVLTDDEIRDLSQEQVDLTSFAPELWYSFDASDGSGGIDNDGTSGAALDGAVTNVADGDIVSGTLSACGS